MSTWKILVRKKMQDNLSRTETSFRKRMQACLAMILMILNQIKSQARKIMEIRWKQIL